MNELIESILSNMTIEIPGSGLPEPDAVNYYVFEKERKVFLDYNVSPEIMLLQRLILRWNKEDMGKPANERTPIRIYIMSYGGDLDYMWMLVDAIRLSVTPIHTINLGVAASAAALIFMAGHRRVMTPRARVLIHEGSAQFAGDANKVMDATDSYKKDLQRMKDFILSVTEIPAKLLNKRRNDDWTLDADMCKEMHVCDEIVETLDEVI